jgi:hypothetical protein
VRWEDWTWKNSRLLPMIELPGTGGGYAEPVLCKADAAK